LPELDIVVGLWTFRGDMKAAKQRIACSGPVQVVATFKDALQHVHQLVQPKLIERDATLPPPPPPPPIAVKPTTAGKRV
jgi:hypothetical protein